MRATCQLLNPRTWRLLSTTVLRCILDIFQQAQQAPSLTASATVARGSALSTRALLKQRLREQTWIFVSFLGLHSSSVIAMQPRHQVLHLYLDRLRRRYADLGHKPAWRGSLPRQNRWAEWQAFARLLNHCISGIVVQVAAVVDDISKGAPALASLT